MSRYAMDKVIWEVTRSADGVVRDRYLADPAKYIEGRDLTPDEREALLAHDVGTLYKMGAHPFMLPAWGMLAWKGEPRAYDQHHVEAVKPYGYPDYTT